ncbi:MAG: porin family protein [Myxococcales bacterium]|nr:porin family protein [Myxococcales bacterium]
MRALRILLLGLLLTSIGSTAVAQDDDEGGASDFPSSGLYVSFSGVRAIEGWPSTNRDAGAENAFGFNLRVGTRTSQWVSLELALEVIDDFFPNDKTDVGVISVFANTRVYPLPGRIQPYALGGMGIVATAVKQRDSGSSFGSSNADWGFRLGAGVDLYYTAHIAVSLEVTQLWTVGDVKDLDHVSLGIGFLYHF